VRVGNAVAIPKEKIAMKKLTRRSVLAIAGLVVAAVAASAQTLTAEIPLEFHLGNHVLAAGAYEVEILKTAAGIPVFRFTEAHLGQSAVLMAQVPFDPRKEWADGKGRLVFACIDRRCALAELWSGPGSHAYSFSSPKPGKGETADLREIPMQPGKSE
jgi:hypothetical protein